jgi:hypothetical protein
MGTPKRHNGKPARRRDDPRTTKRKLSPTDVRMAQNKHRTSPTHNPPSESFADNPSEIKHRLHAFKKQLATKQQLSLFPKSRTDLRALAEKIKGIEVSASAFVLSEVTVCKGNKRKALANLLAVVQIGKVVFAFPKERKLSERYSEVETIAKKKFGEVRHGFVPGKGHMYFALGLPIDKMIEAEISRTRKALGGGGKLNPELARSILSTALNDLIGLFDDRIKEMLPV